MTMSMPITLESQMDEETKVETKVEVEVEYLADEHQDWIIRTEDLWKSYRMGDEDIHALAGVTFQNKRNDYVAIVGPSGSGKSTLMNLIGCLDTPSRGQ